MKWGYIVLGMVLLAGIYAVSIVHNQESEIPMVSLGDGYYAPVRATVTTPTPAPTPAPTPTPTPTPAPVSRVEHPHPIVLRAVVISGKQSHPKQKPEKVPEGYYHYPFRKYRPTYANLIKVLQEMPCPHRYTSNFRCSKFAAFAEWYLENHGFRTDIVFFGWEKPNPKGPNYPPLSMEGHCIVLVHTLNGKYYVDPTFTIYGYRGKNLIVNSLKDEIPSGCKMTSVTIYHNIYQAIKDIGYKVWDWWDYTGYPPRCLR